MQEQMTGYVKSERHGYSMEIEFFHPQGNSLPKALLTDLATQIHSAGMDDDVRIIVLRSQGNRAFCAGASFDELSKIKTIREGEEFFNGFARVINTMRKCPKFIIARVHGKCVGGGVGIVAAADYAIALTGADIKLSELGLGIGPFVVGPAVERKLGLSAYSQLTIDATSWRTAEWAKSRGLFSEVHPNTEELDESLHKLVEHLTHSSPAAMKEIKQVFWAGTANWDVLLSDRAKISGQLVLSEHAQKMIALFRSKT